MKKFIIIFLIFLFLILIIQTTIVQAGEVTVSEYNELKDSITNETNATIILSNDIIVSDDPGLTISNEKNITIDLNGHTMSMQSNVATTSYLIQNYGTLTIKDSVGNGKISYISTNPDIKNSPTYASNTIANRGIITIESGKIENNTEGGVATYCIDNYSNNNTLVTINGGEIYNKSAWGIRQFITSNTLKNDVIINNGKVTGGVYLQVANAEPKANLTINNGTIYGNRYGIYIYDYAVNDSKVNVKINGGNIGANTENGYAMYIYSTNANVLINKGTFTGKYAWIYFTYTQANVPAMIINDGIFNGYCEIDEKFTTNPNEVFTSNVIVNDGKFAEDLYEYAFDGSNWYLANNTKFIKGGYFAKIEDYFDWPKYVVEPFQATSIMKTTPNGYPYTIGHKIVLNANYEGKDDEIIFTLKNGSMSELYDISREKYEFLGWNTKQDGTGVTITANSIINENKTLYAQWKLIPGDIDVLVNNEEDYEIKIDKQELYDAVFTEEDERLMEEGKNITIEIITKDISEEISDEDKEKISNGIGNKKIGMYIDISLLKTIEGEGETYISNTNRKIKITISIPEELLKEDNKNFYIVRMHDGKIEIISSTYDPVNQTITFETDKFSTYAIAYTEQKNEVLDDNTNNETFEENKEEMLEKENVVNPKTGDSIVLYIVLVFTAIIGIVIVSIFRIIKRK